MQYTYSSFRVNALELTNFRMFETLDITFDESITALTAPNGGGKSAVMQALAVACSHFISSVGAYPGPGRVSMRMTTDSSGSWGAAWHPHREMR